MAWTKRSRLALLLLLVLVSLVGGSSASAQDDTITSGAADPTLACDEVTTAEAGADLGTTQQVGDVEVTVTDVSFQDLLDDFWDEGYLVVDFTITNTGDEPYEYSGSYDWTLLDLSPTGTDPDHFDNTALMSDVLIAPGDDLVGHITFPVGFAGGGYRIRYERDGFWGSDDEAFWAVEVEPHRDPSPTDQTSPSIVSTDGFENLEDYEIQVDIDESGSAVFTETITYDFGFYERHGIYRDLTLRQQCNDRYDRIYPLHDVSVESDTAPDQFAIEDIPNGRRIKIGDPDRTIEGTHTYVVRYRLDGTLNGFPDHDEFYWNVIGDGWTVQIANIHVVVNTPGDVTRVACYAGETGSRAACEKAVIGEDGDGRFRQPVLYPSQGLSVVVAFPPDLVPDTSAILDERWALSRAFTINATTVGATLLLTMVCLAAYGLLAFLVGRDRQVAGSPTDVAFATDAAGGTAVPLFEDQITPVEFVPPDNLRPAQLSLILHERVRPNDIAATIVDLAVRGYLRIEEIDGGKEYKLVRLRNTAEGLNAYETKLFDALVPPGTTEIKLSDHDDTFASTFNEVIQDVYEDGMARKWFRKRPDHTRTAWGCLGVALFILASALLVVATLFTHYALLSLPLILASLLVLFGSGKMPARTPVGTGMFRRSRGFEIFMEDSEAPRARWAEQKNIFSEYLPYAIALGIADRWAKTFEPLGEQANASTSGWYVGSQPFSASYLATSTSSFASQASSTLTSVPASSGSSGFSGGGGGGFSGGGGGGGGGGSW